MNDECPRPSPLTDYDSISITAGRAAEPGPWFNLFSPVPFQFNRIDLPIAGLPEDLVGLKLIHISDAHFRSRWSLGWQEMVERINSAQADLIFMTGDFVDSKINSAPAMPNVERFFSSLKSRLGNFAIFGNHDHDFLYRLAKKVAAGGKIASEPWPRRKRDKDREPKGLPIPPRLPAMNYLGHRILDDCREVVKVGEAELEIIGFRGTSRADFSENFLRLLPAKPANGMRIVMSHHPDSIRKLESLEPDLVLAGHTHGGQICLPGHRAIISHDSLPKKCASGLHRFGKNWLLVSRGLGFSSFSIRVFCPPEIVEVTLRRA
ncbi:MAG TPA: metallophosphoesterase [Tepidisphaeraceae bacterium]|jgi:predicted MPP superfamily phosphohydrolase